MKLIKFWYVILFGILSLGILLLFRSENKVNISVETGQEHISIEEEYQNDNQNVLEEGSIKEHSGDRKNKGDGKLPGIATTNNATTNDIHNPLADYPNNKESLAEVLDRLMILEASLDNPEKRLIVKQGGSEIIELGNNPTSDSFNKPVAKFVYQDDLLVSYTAISYFSGMKKENSLYLIYDENKVAIDYKE